MTHELGAGNGARDDPRADGSVQQFASKDLECQIIRGAASLAPLVTAYELCRKGKSDSLPGVLARFRAQNGEIEESYFTRGIDAGAVLVRPNTYLPFSLLPQNRHRRRLLLRYDGRRIARRQPMFDEVLWRIVWAARGFERDSDLILSSASRKVLAERLHQISVFLLGTLASLKRDETVGEGERSSILLHAAQYAKIELQDLSKYANRAARRTALTYYMFGALSLVLLLGLALGGLRDQIFVDPFLVPAGALIAGAIGSVTSVMMRISRGRRLHVDVHQGPIVAVLAGVFRPLIGAVFGAALYFLVQSGILPLAPEEPQKVYFFAALGFLAGFNERWAQDTIVNSAPGNRGGGRDHGPAPSDEAGHDPTWSAAPRRRALKVRRRGRKELAPTHDFGALPDLSDPIAEQLENGSGDRPSTPPGDADAADHQTNNH